MAIHETEAQMVREALPEYLELARIGSSLGKQPNGGVLGYPSATCLFAVVDTIGSYHRGDPSYTVQVEDKLMTINSTGDHILILNSPYFEYTFTEAGLRAIYSLGRSPLTHNALLGQGLLLWVGEPQRPAIEAKADGVHVYLPAFLERCEIATKRFLEVSDEVIPKSLAVRKLQAKAEETYNEQAKTLMENIMRTLDAAPVAQASAMGGSPGSNLDHVFKEGGSPDGIVVRR